MEMNRGKTVLLHPSCVRMRVAPVQHGWVDVSQAGGSADQQGTELTHVPRLQCLVDEGHR